MGRGGRGGVGDVVGDGMRMAGVGYGMGRGWKAGGRGGVGIELMVGSTHLLPHRR